VTAVASNLGEHDCTPLLPIGIRNASPWTCPECGAEWFFAAGPVEGDWFRVPEEVK
jgi:hypothetical protein